MKKLISILLILSLFTGFTAAQEETSDNSFVFDFVDSILGVGGDVDSQLNSEIQEIAFATVLIALTGGIVYVVSFGDVLATILSISLGVLTAILVDGYYPKWMGLIGVLFVVFIISRLIIDFLGGDE